MSLKIGTNNENTKNTENTQNTKKILTITYTKSVLFSFIWVAVTIRVFSVSHSMEFCLSFLLSEL